MRINAHTPWIRALRQRYFALTDEGIKKTETMEDTILEELENPENPCKIIDKDHRNYHPKMEALAPGTKVPAFFSGVPGARRRLDSRLGVSRLPMLDPCGTSRETFYQAQLLQGLAWYASEPPVEKTINGKQSLVWTIRWRPPSQEDLDGASLQSEQIEVGTAPTGISFEHTCKALEDKFSDPERAT